MKAKAIKTLIVLNFAFLISLFLTSCSETKEFFDTCLGPGCFTPAISLVFVVLAVYGQRNI